MPELPEVETIKRDLERVIIKKRITEIQINRKNIIKAPGLKKFKSLLLNGRCMRIFRRGKLLILEIKTADNQKYFLTIHLRMSGQLVFGRKDPCSRLSLRLSDNNYLSYKDQRALGELRLVKDWQQLNIVKSMGPEPLDKKFSLPEFTRRLQERKSKIKPLLLDQTFIAGIGNIYAAEALFYSGISPLRRAVTLSKKEIQLLYKNIKKVLQKAIQYRGSSFSDYRDGRGRRGNFAQHFSVYGRAGRACFRCRGKINRVVLGGRGTYFCAKCQK